MGALSEFQQVFDDMELRVLGDASKGYMAEIVTQGTTASAELPPLPSEELAGTSDPRQYGRILFDWVFRDDVRECFMRTRWSAESYTRAADPVPLGGLRLRLWLDPYAAKLHRLWWETLYDPRRDEPLALTLVFSRYVRSRSPFSRPASERPLRMLLLAVNPEGLDRFKLQDINMMLERKIVSAATQQLSGLMVMDQFNTTPTLGEISHRLGEGYHILHLLSHAVFDPPPSDETHDDSGQGYLILADENGVAKPVPFKEVTRLISGSAKRPPHLIFLGAPLTTEADVGEHVGNTVASLAPLLINKAGAQSVVAIQAPINHNCLLRFTERFYDTLLSTGLIDVAMSAARSTVYDNAPESWEWAHPVLYMRTPDARIFQPLSERAEQIVQGVALGMREGRFK